MGDYDDDETMMTKKMRPSWRRRVPCRAFAQGAPRQRLPASNMVKNDDYNDDNDDNNGNDDNNDNHDNDDDLL